MEDWLNLELRKRVDRLRDGDTRPPPRPLRVGGERVRVAPEGSLVVKVLAERLFE